jgi:hypothetical protein
VTWKWFLPDVSNAVTTPGITCTESKNLLHSCTGHASSRSLYSCSKWILKAWRCRSSRSIRRTNLTFPPGTRVYRPADRRGICHVAFHVSLVFFRIFTDTTGGRFGLESLNDPYSHGFLIRHNTSLRGGAKRLRNFWRRPNCVAVIELVLIMTSTTTVSFDQTTASWRPNSNEHATRTVKARTEVVIFPQRAFSRYREFSWLPRSPWLSAVDFFLWGCLKGQACKIYPAIISHLKQHIKGAMKRHPTICCNVQWPLCHAECEGAYMAIIATWKIPFSKADMYCILHRVWMYSYLQTLL